MKHRATLLDAAADLRRAIYASLSEKGFEDPNFKIFFEHAQTIISQSANASNERALVLAHQCLDRAAQFKGEPTKTREDVLTAACLLQQ